MKRGTGVGGVARKLFEYIGNQELRLTKDGYAWRIHKRDGDPIDDQIISVSNMPDRKRISIACRDDNSIKTISKFLDENGIIYDISIGNLTCFYLYPNAKRELLEIKAQPTEGNIQVLQGEYAITKADDPNPILSTFGLGSCVGLLLYDPEVKCGGLAHVDYDSQIMNVFNEIIKKLEKFGGKEFEFGYTPNIDPMRKEYEIKERHRDLISEEFELPEAFSFDTRDGEIYPWRNSFDPTLEKRLEKIDYRIQEHISKHFCVYEPK